MVEISRRYLSLVLIILVASTAITVIMWLVRTGNPVEVLLTEAPNAIFTDVYAPRTISFSVAPEKRLDRLEFRFRSLRERSVPKQLLDPEIGPSITELLDACPAVSARMEYFRSIGGEPFIAVRDVRLSNADEGRVVVVDFGHLFSALFEPSRDNDSLTTFAFLLNETDHVESYFEGYSQLFVAQEHLLELARLESGDEVAEYAPSPMGDQAKIDDMAPYGRVVFENAERGVVKGVTLVLKKRKTEIPEAVYQSSVAANSYLEMIETFVEGKWVEEASSYWHIMHGGGAE